MTLLSFAPSTWFSITANEPTPGPGYLEICEGHKVEENGIAGYVIDGYGDEPYDGRWFVVMEAVEVEQQEIQYA